MSQKESDSIPRPCACTTVRTVSRLLARVYDGALQESELNVTQLAVLRAIDRMRGEPLSRVAENLSMDRTSMYRAVGTLEGNGWVRVIYGKDARSRSAVISSAGRDVLDDAVPHWEGIQSSIVERFGQRRWQSLVSELRELGTVAQDVEAGSATQGRKADTL
ncbi:MAG: MarR family winged helix-turn-helix transcriptional regulator [Planctomycetota bacterium]